MEKPKRPSFDQVKETLRDLAKIGQIEICVLPAWRIVTIDDLEEKDYERAEVRLIGSWVEKTPKLNRSSTAPLLRSLFGAWPDNIFYLLGAELGVTREAGAEGPEVPKVKIPTWFWDKYAPMLRAGVYETYEKYS